MLGASTKPIDDNGVVELIPGIRQIEGTVTQGTVTQRYRFLSRIGVGGMGDVFLGIQKGAVDFQRLIVLKRVHSHLLQNQSHAKMFVDEASLVAKLNHPNIVNIIDFRQTNDAFFIVMEYVNGETLRTIRTMCAKRKITFPFPLACKLMISACDALNYAHNATSHTGKPLNIIHRDIGLHNLMIDRNGYLKVIDFGIAKSAIQTDFTTPDIVKGNPSYMAPDVFIHEEIDHRVDIYALGLSLFELLTSERVFKFGKNIPLSNVIQKITRGEIPTPSSIVPSIPKKLDAIVKKATIKDRDRRYQTVAELAEDLQNVARSHALAFRNCDPKEWFSEHFSERFEERILFEKELLSHAESTSKQGVDSYAPPPVSDSQTDVSVELKKASDQSAAQKVELTRKKSLLIIGVVAALVLAFGILVIFMLQPNEQPIVNQTGNTAASDDNLFIKSTPLGADIFINGDRVGTTSETGEYFRVPPNSEHMVVIKKTNYEDYYIKITVPQKGERRINATLVVKGNKTGKELTAPLSEDTPPVEQHVNEQSKKQSSSASKSRHSKGARVKTRAKSEIHQLSDVAPKKERVQTPSSSATKPKSTVPLLEETNKNSIPLLDKKTDNIPLL